MKMRAAVLEEFGAPLAVQEVELAEPRAGEVLVRLVACGVCHTDLYTASGADPSGYAPAVLGHEGAGVVEKVGEGVGSVAPGDHVVTLFSPQCRECIHCRDERTNLCLAIREEQNRGHLPDGTTRISRDGEDVRHFMGCSTFAEYTVMPEIALAKINPEAPFEHACLFACGLSTGLGAAINTAGVRAGSTCAVFGAGMVGLGAVAGCRLQGAERIICVDLSPERLELARGQGATDLLGGGETTVERILEMTDGFGADYTFEATGNVAVMRQALEAARMGWGALHRRRRRRQGRDPRCRPAVADHRPPRRRLLLRRRQGPRPGAGPDRPLPRRRDRRRPVPLASDLPRRSQPRLRADGGPGWDPQRHRALLMAMAGSEEASAAISPTAHYTGETWVRNGLSHPELATWQGRLFHGTLALPNAASRLLGGPSLDGMLLARHRIIDALLDDQIQGGITQVIEIACGMSARGWRFSDRYGTDLTYIEADLPAMAQRKREALAQMGSLDEHHRVVELDALRDGGPNSLEALVESMDPSEGLAIITEGLLVYLDDETTEALWARLARALRPFAPGVYLSDFRIARPERGVSERAFEVILGAFVRGRIHPYRGDEASAEAALHAAGFQQASLHRGDEHPAGGRDASAGMLSIIEAAT